MDATTNKTENSEEREEVGGGRQQSNGRFVIVVSRGFPFRAEDQTCVAIRETHPRDQNSQNSRTSLKYLRSQRINFDKLHRVNVRARSEFVPSDDKGLVKRQRPLFGRIWHATH